MNLKRIKCFLTGGHRYRDMNMMTIHDTTGYHFINHCEKCGKVYATFLPEMTLTRQIERDLELFRKGRF